MAVSTRMGLAVGATEAEMPEGGDSAELFVQFFSKNERKLRAFLYHLLPGTEGVAEVMPEVSLVLWKKFDRFDPGTEFLK